MVMRYYITAHRKDGSPILGNLDGQASLGERKQPRLTAAWRHLTHPHYTRPNYASVWEWRLVDERDNVILTHRNTRYRNMTND